MPMNIRLSDEANAVLDAFVLEKSVTGMKLEKGLVASQAVIDYLMPQLTPSMQHALGQKFPELAPQKKTK